MRLIAAAWVVAGLLSACAGDSRTGAPPTQPARSAPASAVELAVFAAASLRDALERAAAAYESGHPGVRITLSTDSSAALETQIEQGAPADVFLSADTTSPAKLVAGGFASGEPVDFAGNTLVIIVPKGNPAGVMTPFDLAKRGLKLVAAGDAVPITRYASRLIANLAALPDAPAGFEAACAANVVSKEENVKAVVVKVELGEGDAGIVYATDAAASARVDVVRIAPAGANVTATYAGVVVNGSGNPAEASAFLAWLAGPDGQAVLASFGFLPPPA